MSHAHEMMRSMLRSFVADPPDNEYQVGYLDSLIVFAVDGLGMDPSDIDVRLAMALTNRDAPPPPPRPLFQVIQGGKTDNPDP